MLLEISITAPFDKINIKENNGISKMIISDVKKFFLYLKKLFFFRLVIFKKNKIIKNDKNK